MGQEGGPDKEVVDLEGASFYPPYTRVIQALDWLESWHFGEMSADYRDR